MGQRLALIAIEKNDVAGVGLLLEKLQTQRQLNCCRDQNDSQSDRLQLQLNPAPRHGEYPHVRPDGAFL
jgi:hypothetical protein